jgi:hypothetical protein
VASDPALRASDFEREQVAERLRQATAEGRLRTDELEERLGAAFSARTHGELEPLVSDLPAPPAAPARRSRAPLWTGGAAAVTLLLAVLGSLAGERFHSHIPASPVDHGFGVAITMLVAVAIGLTLCAAAGWLISQAAGASDA